MTTAALAHPSSLPLITNTTQACRNNDKADVSIAMEGVPWDSQMTFLRQQLSKEATLRAVICTAGGWVGGSAKEPADTLASGMDKMHSSCVQTALTAAHGAAHHLLPQGTVIFTGAAAALGPTPTMLAYGVAKAATHHITKSLAAPDSGLPEGAKVLAVLPRTLDTPNNRKYMAGADTSTWTPLQEVSVKMLEICERRDKGPTIPSGALLKAITEGGVTTWELA